MKCERRCILISAHRIRQSEKGNVLIDQSEEVSSNMVFILKNAAFSPNSSSEVFSHRSRVNDFQCSFMFRVSKFAFKISSFAILKYG